jgi:hypothetical protein
MAAFWTTVPACATEMRMVFLLFTSGQPADVANVNVVSCGRCTRPDGALLQAYRGSALDIQSPTDGPVLTLAG